MQPAEQLGALLLSDAHDQGAQQARAIGHDLAGERCRIETLSERNRRLLDACLFEDNLGSIDPFSKVGFRRVALLRKHGKVLLYSYDVGVASRNRFALPDVHEPVGLRDLFRARARTVAGTASREDGG